MELDRKREGQAGGSRNVGMKKNGKNKLDLQNYKGNKRGEQTYES